MAGAVYEKITNIKGPQGDRGPDGSEGPRGLKGDPGTPALDAVPTDAGLATYITSGSTQTRAALNSEVPSIVADAVANPEEELHDAVVQIAYANPNPGIPYEYFIGTTTSAARPAWNGPVRWLTTVEAKPTNVRIAPPTGVAPDSWSYVLPDAAVQLVWSDNFDRADASTVGTTNVGAKAWTTVVSSPGDGVLGIASNEAKVLSGTGGSVRAVVDSGYARGVTTVVLSNVIVFGLGVVFRHVSLTNAWVIARVSSSNGHYRLVKYVNSATPTQVKEFDVAMTSGDVIVVDDSVLGQLKIKINGVTKFDEQVDGAVTENASATRQGIFANGSAVGATWASAKFERVL